MKNATLVFLIKRNHSGEISYICLAMKKRGFGAGKFNGAGGKTEKDESIEDAAIRETFEEISVKAENLYQVAKFKFTFPHNPSFDQMVYAFFCEKWSGEPTESEEMKPEWFGVEDIPWSKMWVDDKFWLPQVIKGKLVIGEFDFGPGEDEVLRQKIEYTKSF